MASIQKSAILVTLAAGFAVTASHAVLTWTGCDPLANANFQAVSLATRSRDTAAEPMKMAFDLVAAPGEDAKGKVDVYFTERLGKVRKFDSKSSKVLTLAKIPLNIDAVNSSDGVLGIALDPGFKTNHYAYIYYTFISTSEKSWRVARFTLNAAHTSMDLASEVSILKIPILGGSKHPGGAMQFDAYGDLWISTGNDYKSGDFPTYSSPNTNDLRGKILRIHPVTEQVDGKYYTIPAGNLFAPNLAKTRSEIYVMGTRNPYTISLDPVRRWLVFGDVGPDSKDMDGNAMNDGGTEKTEEYDLATAPGNYGYPFFAGDYQTKSGINAAAPAMASNTDWGPAGQGLATLPPAIAPIYAYKKACAITGPIYRYDGDLNSTVKFPPHYQRKWLVTDFNGDNNKVNVFTLSDDGGRITATDNNVFGGIPLHSPLDLQFGPDGALYVNNYDGYRTSGTNTGIVRIEYNGTCRPALPKLETAGGTSIASGNPRGMAPWQGPHVDIVQGLSLSVSVGTAGRFSLDVRDLMGRPVAFRSGEGPAPVALAEVRNAGVYLLHVITSDGSRVVKLVRN